MEPPSPAPAPDEPDRPPPRSAEDRIIARLLAAGHRDRVALSLPPGDDAAALADGTVLTTDALVEGVHWNERLSAADVGYKAVAVSASDVAACGARPTWMLLDLAVPADDDWAAGFAAGLAEAALAYDVDLIGGDTTSLPPGSPRFVAITMAGTPTSAGPISRSGGRAGDIVLVTGCPGLAGAGYLHADPAPAALLALRRPTSRVAFALDVAPWITASMDLSDGLAADLPRLCAASQVGAVIDPAALPVHPAMRDGAVPVRTLQLAAGDDYELLLCVDPDKLDWVLSRAAAHQVPCHPIGQLMHVQGAQLTDGPWPAPPWSHFQGGGS